MMSSILFGVVPGVVAIGVVVVSVRSVVRVPSAIQVALALPTVCVATWSLLILERIVFDKAWPTFLPFITIPATVPLAALQWQLARYRQPDINERALFVVGVALVAISVTPLALMVREVAMASAAAARYSTEQIQSLEPGMAGGALRAEIGGHVVALEDDRPFEASGDVRIKGLVRIVIDGQDRSTNAPAEIRLNSRDANRYWGYVYLMRLLDRRERTQRLVVAQNLLDGRFRTLTVSADGSVIEDEFHNNERCDPPIRGLLIDYVVGSPSGLCSDGKAGWAAVFYPVVYPWLSCAFGLTCLIDAQLIRKRRAPGLVSTR